MERQRTDTRCIGHTCAARASRAIKCHCISMCIRVYQSWTWTTRSRSTWPSRTRTRCLNRTYRRSICSADGSTHTESNKLYRKVKHRYHPNLSPRQRPMTKSRHDQAALAASAEARGATHRARHRSPKSWYIYVAMYLSIHLCTYVCIYIYIYMSIHIYLWPSRTSTRCISQPTSQGQRRQSKVIVYLCIYAFINLGLGRHGRGPRGHNERGHAAASGPSPRRRLHVTGVTAASSGTHTRWCRRQASSLALSSAPVAAGQASSLALWRAQQRDVSILEGRYRQGSP